jgi:hypothetical protein
MMTPSCSATTKRSISISRRRANAHQHALILERGDDRRMPPTSSMVALRSCASGAAAIMVPTLSRVNSSSSSAPS